MVTNICGVKQTRFEHLLEGNSRFANNMRKYREHGVARNIKGMKAKLKMHGIEPIFVGYAINLSSNTY